MIAGDGGELGNSTAAALMNQAIHNVDLLYHMMGPVVEVSAFTALLAHERIEVEDTAVATLRFANGALGTITATTSVYPGLEDSRHSWRQRLGRHRAGQHLKVGIRKGDASGPTNSRKVHEYHRLDRRRQRSEGDLASGTRPATCRFRQSSENRRESRCQR